MKTILGRTVKTAGAALSTVFVAGLGLPALGAVLLLAILILAVLCWVILSQERTDRVSRLFLASRGDARCLPRPIKVSADSGISRGK
jgi:hypothetical protein